MTMRIHYLDQHWLDLHKTMKDTGALTQVSELLVQHAFFSGCAAMLNCISRTDEPLAMVIRAIEAKAFLTERMEQLSAMYDASTWSQS
jgi:hypothetical protein